MKKKTILLLCSFMLLCVCLCGCKEKTNDTTAVANSDTPEVETASLAPESAYWVRLTINPDVYFGVDENGQVVGMIAGNDDAQDVINNFAPEDKSLAVVLAGWVDCCDRMGFNTSKMEMSVIGAGENKTAELTKIYTDLRSNNGVEGDAELVVEEEVPEFPTCVHCGEMLYSDNDVCPHCGEAMEEDTYYCFCGAKMRSGEDLCPVCHLYNYSGEYEEGWGPNGKEFVYCFCGERADYKSGYCKVCHLNNITGTYDEGWGPEGEEKCEERCIECGSTNVTYGTFVCKNCMGTKLTTCFQCGGSGTDYVTAADGGEGWYETCTNCNGTGQWPCQGCSKQGADRGEEYGYTCHDCGREWSVE